MSVILLRVHLSGRLAVALYDDLRDAVIMTSPALAACVDWPWPYLWRWIQARGLTYCLIDVTGPRLSRYDKRFRSISSESEGNAYGRTEHPCLEAA